MSDTDFYIKLLELEIEALRSVISEFEEDRSALLQWQLAETLESLRMQLRRPG